MWVSRGICQGGGRAVSTFPTGSRPGTPGELVKHADACASARRIRRCSPGTSTFNKIPRDPGPNCCCYCNVEAQTLGKLDPANQNSVEEWGWGDARCCLFGGRAAGTRRESSWVRQRPSVLLTSLVRSS